MRAQIGGVDVVLRGPPILQGVTEFNTGVRQGNPSNDDRNLASFVTLEDARGGIGKFIADIREDPDQLFDSDGAFNSRFGQLTKPTKLSTTAFAVDEVSTATRGGAVLESDIGGTNRLWIGLTTDLYYSTGTSVTSLTKTTNDPIVSGANITRLMDWTAPGGGRYMLVAGKDEDFGDAFNLRRATTPTTGTWTSVTGSDAQDLFEFDGKLYLMGENLLKWTIDIVTPVLNTVTGNWPTQWRFIGIFPFGQTFLPYVLINPTRNPRLAVLDPDAGQLRVLDLGQVGSISDAIPFEGQIALINSNRSSVLLYNPEERSVRNLDWGGLRTRDGYASGRPGRVHILFPSDEGLMAVADTEAGATQLFEFRQTGWSPYGVKTSGGPTAAAAAVANTGLHHAGLHQLVWVTRTSGDDARLQSLAHSHDPYIPGALAENELENGDVAVITPWTNVGFADLTGALIAAQCGGYFSATAKVKVEYQVDFNEASWTLLGTFPGTAATIPEVWNRSEVVATTTQLLFAPASLAGVSFRWVRFRITLQTVTDHFRSPNAFPLTIRFIKRPKLRDSIRLDVDVQATIQGNGDIDSVAALLKALRDVYVQDTIPLLRFYADDVQDGVTYGLMTSFPRVLTFGAEGSDGDVAQDQQLSMATIVLTFAEPL